MTLYVYLFCFARKGIDLQVSILESRAYARLKGSIFSRELTV